MNLDMHTHAHTHLLLGSQLRGTGHLELVQQVAQQRLTLHLLVAGLAPDGLGAGAGRRGKERGGEGRRGKERGEERGEKRRGEERGEERGGRSAQALGTHITPHTSTRARSLQPEWRHLRQAAPAQHLTSSAPRRAVTALAPAPARALTCRLSTVSSASCSTLFLNKSGSTRRPLSPVLALKDILLTDMSLSGF